MRSPVPEHKTVYVRFHKRLDGLLDAYSKKTGMRRATAVSYIENRYFSLHPSPPEIGDTVKPEDFGFTGLEEVYFIPHGRSQSGSVLGRGMQITVNRAQDRMLSLYAAALGISERDFRTGILVSYFLETGMLSQSDAAGITGK